VRRRWRHEEGTPLGRSEAVKAVSTSAVSTPPPALLADDSPKSVLIVEDDDRVATFFERSLRERSYLIHRASSGEDAMGLTQTMSFDAIVSDIAMPGLDGIQLLKRVRERDSDVPFVLVTGKPEIQSAINAVEYGALSYLVKPIRPRELQEAVAKAIERKTAATMYRRAVRALAESKERARLQKLNESHFRSALEDLYMDYLPVVEPTGGRVLGYEASVRTREPALSRPVELLSTAEELGMVEVLGRRARQALSRGIDGFPADSLLFVSLHPRELLDEEIYSTSNPLRKHAPRIVFELFEQVRLENVDEAVHQIRTLRSGGFRFAVDDLGAGYAALTNLVRFEPEFAKIDATLVRDVDRFPAKKMLIGSLVRACSDLSTRIVCEAVESEAEGHCLLDLGVELLQGPYFAGSRPFFDCMEQERLEEHMKRFVESWKALAG
jgi:EAL domain-containing protein (putative c-di-GMP-specific phosphodiesterase class I)